MQGQYRRLLGGLAALVVVGVLGFGPDISRMRYASRYHATSDPNVVLNNFDSLDRNSDGSLTEDEAPGLRRFDTDGNGLTRQELERY